MNHKQNYFDFLSQIKIIDRTIVIVQNMPFWANNASLLVNDRFFGKYGDIVKIKLVHRIFNTKEYFDVWIQYKDIQSAINCIESVDKSIIEDIVVSCTHGIHSFCNSFIENKKCTDIACFDKHWFDETIKIEPQQVLIEFSEYCKNYKGRNYKRYIIGNNSK